jgi:hypothetical protein
LVLSAFLTILVGAGSCNACPTALVLVELAPDCTVAFGTCLGCEFFLLVLALVAVKRDGVLETPGSDCPFPAGVATAVAVDLLFFGIKTARCYSARSETMMSKVVLDNRARNR